MGSVKYALASMVKFALTLPEHGGKTTDVVRFLVFNHTGMPRNFWEAYALHLLEHFESDSTVW